MFVKKRWVFMTALAALVCVGYASANTTSPADFDEDGVVGFSDFLLFVEKFGSNRGDGTYQIIVARIARIKSVQS